MTNAHHKKFIDQRSELKPVQIDLLTDAIASLKDSQYNRKLGAGTAIESSFCDSYPLVTYQDIQDDVDRIVAGQTHVLSTERTLALFKTSGTSSKSKLIPVTSSLLRQKASAFASFWGWVYQDYPEIEKGVLVSNFMDASITEKTASGLDICSESNFWSRRGRSLNSIARWPLPKEIREIEQLQVRLYATARLLLQSDVHCIMCLNPSTLLQFCRFLDQNQNLLEKGLVCGDWGIGDCFPITPHDRAVLQNIEHRLLVDLNAPERLREARASGSKILIKALWPMLQLVICWRSELVQPYHEQLQDYLVDIPMRDYISQSSECILAIPNKDLFSGGVLAYQSHFFEFIEERKANQNNPTTLFAWELNVGCRYEVVVTTGGGLTRYRTGDCVLVKDFFGQVPVIEFLYRLGKTSSITGEKLTEHQIILAAKMASETTGYSPHEYFCFPGSGELPSYQLLLEFDNESDFSEALKARAARWATAFDQSLREINTEYGDKCSSGRLGDIKLKVLSFGTLAHLRRASRPLSVSDEQIKVDVLSSEVDWHLKFLPEVA